MSTRARLRPAGSAASGVPGASSIRIRGGDCKLVARLRGPDRGARHGRARPHLRADQRSQRPAGDGHRRSLRWRATPVPDHYHEALVLLIITALLFVTRSILSVLGLWLTLAPSNDRRLESDRTPASRACARSPGHAPRAQLVRDAAHRPQFGRPGHVRRSSASSVSLLSNMAVAVAVALGLFLSSPSVAAAVTIYFVVIGVRAGSGSFVARCSGGAARSRSCRASATSSCFKGSRARRSCSSVAGRSSTPMRRSPALAASTR